MKYFTLISAFLTFILLSICHTGCVADKTINLLSYKLEISSAGFDELISQNVEIKFAPRAEKTKIGLLKGNFEFNNAILANGINQTYMRINATDDINMHNFDIYISLTTNQTYTLYVDAVLDPAEDSPSIYRYNDGTFYCTKLR